MMTASTLVCFVQRRFGDRLIGLCLGFGSNLTFDGHVECDAALMDGSTGDFGSIGAISGQPNSHPLSLRLFISEQE